MTRATAIAAFGVVLALLLGATAAITLGRFRQTAESDPFGHCRTSRIAGGPGAIGGPFTLTGETGETLTDADVISEPSLLYFGYTFCPDVCPLDTARNAEAVDLLAARGLQAQPVFITVDPNRDTPEVLDRFTANLHPRMRGLTGTSEQIDAVADAYRVYYRINRQGDDPFYLVDHSAFTYLVLPDRGFVEFFHRDLTPMDLADRAACFLEAAGS